MLCQDCNKRESQVHFTQIVNNEKTSLSLCKECAAARGFHSPLDNIPFPLANILSGLAADLPRQRKAEPVDDISCQSCGLTFDQFTKQGRFGCGDCYKAFRNRLEMIMRKIHGASLHRGLVPVFDEKEDADIKEVAAAAELTVEQIERVYKDIDSKRKATKYLQREPVLIQEVF